MAALRSVILLSWTAIAVHMLLDGPAISKVQTNERSLERNTRIDKQNRITNTTSKPNGNYYFERIENHVNVCSCQNLTIKVMLHATIFNDYFSRNKNRHSVTWRAGRFLAQSSFRQNVASFWMTIKNLQQCCQNFVGVASCNTLAVDFSRNIFPEACSLRPRKRSYEWKQYGGRWLRRIWSPGNNPRSAFRRHWKAHVVGYIH